MYAIVDIAGQQFKVEKKQKLYVHRLEQKEGSLVDFDQVLLLVNDGKITVGTPVVNNIVVTAKVISHLKGDKVKVFKKKRRKGYQKLNGHRQCFTEISIEDIAAPKAKKAQAESKKEEPVKAKVKPAQKTAPKAKPATAEKKTKDQPKPAAQKTTIKKSTTVEKEEKKTTKTAATKKTTAKKTTTSTATKKATTKSGTAKKTTTAQTSAKKTEKKDKK